jgi:galactonate dehydratase
MKITDVRTVLLTGPSTNDRFPREARRLRSAAFIELYTDAGLVGIGETYAGYFCPELVPHTVEFFKPILVGQQLDPQNLGSIDELWRRMYTCENFWCRVGFGAIVLTALEAAMWDLAGKALRKPVYELLGGAKHAKLPCYATGGPANYPKSRLAEKVDYYLGLGFRGFKVGAGAYEHGKSWSAPKTLAATVDFETDKVAFLRKHVGDAVNIMLDGHMGNSPSEIGVWDLDTAKAVLKAAEPYSLFFYEEPLPYRDADAYARLAASTTTPVAGGECLSAMPEWREYIRCGSFRIAQPDASFVGGLREFGRIASEWEKRGNKVATHAWGAGGSLMQNFHAAFAAPNACMLEVPPDFAELHSMVLVEPLPLKDGFIHRPTALGLGIQLTDELKRRFPFQPGSGEFNSVPGKILTT